MGGRGASSMKVGSTNTPMTYNGVGVHVGDTISHNISHYVGTDTYQHIRITKIHDSDTFDYEVIGSFSDDKSAQRYANRHYNDSVKGASLSSMRRRIISVNPGEHAKSMIKKKKRELKNK